MNFQDCIKFANEHTTCYLATTEGDQPRVRALGMWFADETGFYFESKSVKAFNKQMKKNPKVEVIFHAPDAKPVETVMRVAGEVEFIDDMKLRTKVFEEKPHIRAGGVKSPEDPLLSVFAIRKGEAYFWTMANNMKEAEIPRIKF
jgi:pyridoxamine 5'-phosphate oxidase